MAPTGSDTPANGHATANRWPVRVWLALAAACLAVFLVFGLSVQRWEPWLAARLGEDSFVVSAAFELVGALLIAGPLAGLIRAVSALGHDRGRIDGQGRTTLQVRDGARRLHVVLCIGLFILFAAGAAILRDDTTLRIASAAAAAFSVIGGYIIWTARLIYDEHGLIVPRFARRPRQFQWQHLRGVTWVEELDHFRLDFTKGRKTTISSTYAGSDKLIALARRICAANAGTARS